MHVILHAISISTGRRRDQVWPEVQAPRRDFGRVGERYDVRHELRPLPGGQAAPLQTLLLQGVYRVAGEALARAALPLPGVSRGRDSSLRRRRAATERVLRGGDERIARQNGKSGGEGGGGRAALERETRHVLSPVYYRLHLRQVSNAPTTFSIVCSVFPSRSLIVIFFPPYSATTSCCFYWKLYLLRLVHLVIVRIQGWTWTNIPKVPSNILAINFHC